MTRRKGKKNQKSSQSRASTTEDCDALTKTAFTDEADETEMNVKEKQRKDKDTEKKNIVTPQKKKEGNSENDASTNSKEQKALTSPSIKKKFQKITGNNASTATALKKENDSETQAEKENASLQKVTEKQNKNEQASGKCTSSTCDSILGAEQHSSFMKKALPCPSLDSLKRSYNDELKFLTKVSSTLYKVDVGFVPNMQVPAFVVVNDDLEKLLLEELQASCDGNKKSGVGFLPALKQVSNVAALPGIVKASLAMPDIHSGYGFCIGNVAAFDMDEPDAVVRTPCPVLPCVCFYRSPILVVYFRIKTFLTIASLIAL